MATFLTGSTGYLGSYVVSGLLQEHAEPLKLLVRADSVEHAERRLWRALQLHMPFEVFLDHLRGRVEILLGDLTRARFGLDAAAWDDLVHGTDAILHVAASLNRKSAKACFNVNLRGTLEVLKLARAAADHHGLRRLSDVSTTAVAGHRQGEVIQEDEAIDWSRSDYDPYARTKKLCEHMIHELLPEVPTTVFRPSIVLGDARFPETTQFDMVRAFCILARMPVLPFDPDWRLDIVSADYVGRAIVHVHQVDEPSAGAYHLSAGQASLTYRQITSALREAGVVGRTRYLPRAGGSVRRLVDALAASPRRLGVAPAATLLKVFWPYLTFDTVFDNRRIVSELGSAPVPFTDYAPGLLRFVVDGGFRYPYRDWPAASAAPEPRAAGAPGVA